MFSMLKKYLRWHSNIFLKYYEKRLPYFSDRFFVRAFNMLLGIKNNRSKMSFNSQKNYFCIEEGNLTQIFKNKSQATHSYSNGLVNRAYQIADSYMLNEINFKPNDTVVDIGANVGDLYLFFKHLNTKISYIGIEPGENEFFCLNNNIDGSCINAAVSDKNGVQNFFINEDGADSSLIEPLIYTETREIKTITLDSMNFQQKIKLIKIEAEGNEPEILRGAIETLKISEYVSADLGPERGVLQESTYEEFIKLMFKNGFDLKKINPERLIVLFKNKSYVK